VFYSLLFRVVFSKLDPEFIHHVIAWGLRVAGKVGITSLFRDRSIKQSVSAFGLGFPGPFGLAAGFDKNATMVKPLADLGFSHIEIGTVTALAQPGNPKPRLFRLTADRALVNRMGFNNDGAAAVASRLAKLRRSQSKLPIIGVNIGKSKVTPVEKAADDYRTSARLLAPVADYFAVNVSSPNTPGLRSLQAVESLEPILMAVLEEAKTIPVLVKIAPDLADEDIVEIAELAVRLNLAGIIATNTTISRAGLKSGASIVSAAGDGGLSGEPLKDRAFEVLKLLRDTLPKDFAVVSVGGVETEKDLQDRLSAGATLVQGYTGFVYQGPFWARRLNHSWSGVSRV
jgi:dihydroorotate dehydrogenase